ncbi:hypothetical protein RND71_030319 [Anisodus tanguticus]|uniref:Uncharacterized protein n=1 Tax=Anisodus tanguticus TaxID=243964 RepID=A0AAE1RH94_9SOLA|nr:hypothetical protein RND71_030319 [Anisodus tanguticus]
MNLSLPSSKFIPYIRCSNSTSGSCSISGVQIPQNSPFLAMAKGKDGPLTVSPMGFGTWAWGNNFSGVIKIQWTLNLSALSILPCRMALTCSIRLILMELPGKFIRIRVIANSPLGLGMLTGKYTPSNLPPGPRQILPGLEPLLTSLRQIAQRRRKTIPPLETLNDQLKNNLARGSRSQESKDNELHTSSENGCTDELNDSPGCSNSRFGHKRVNEEDDDTTEETDTYFNPKEEAEFWNLEELEDNNSLRHSCIGLGSISNSKLRDF